MFKIDTYWDRWFALGVTFTVGRWGILAYLDIMWFGFEFETGPFKRKR